MDYGQPTGEYKPLYNEVLVRNFLDQFHKTPGAFTPELIAQVKEDADFYGLDIEAPMSIGGILSQAGAGFISGFTTFNVGEEPENSAERIARNVGSLAGFVGYVPALPAKAGMLAKAATFLKGKSIPMLASGYATKAVRSVTSDVTRKAIAGRASAFKTTAEFLQKSPVKNTLEGAFHLGVASSVSAWQGGIDEMMHGFIGGAQTGAAFRLIGNLIKLPEAGIPKFGAKWKDLTPPQRGEKSLKMLAASLYTGLPATLRGETAPEQIYEYLLGAYFGFNETSAEHRTRDKQLIELFRQDKKTNPLKLPELSPNWDKLSGREQKLVTEERNRIWDERGTIIGQKLQELLGQSVTIPQLNEEAGKQKKAPEPTTDIQLEVRDQITDGKDITPEMWKTMSKEDKAFYSESVDVAGLRGLYTFQEVSRWDRATLESVAKVLKVKSITGKNDAEIASEIMFAQSKRADGLSEIVALANEGDGVKTKQEDIGEMMEIDSVDFKSVNFVKNELEPYFKTLGAADKLQEINNLSKEVELKVLEILESEKPDSREFMKWARDRFGVAEFSTASEGMIRQWFKLADPKNVKQVPFVSARIVYGEEGEPPLVFVDQLATSGTPVDALGNRKLMRFPKNRLDKIWDEIGDGTSVYMVGDNFLISDKGGMSGTSFFRLKQQLEREFSKEVIDRWEEDPTTGKNVPIPKYDYQGNIVTEGAQRFYEHMYDVMTNMAEKNNSLYFGGAGDKERAYFVKQHPSVQKKLDYETFTGQLGEILRAVAPSSYKELYKTSEELFLSQYNIAEGTELYEQARDYHARAFTSNFLWDLQMQGFKIPSWTEGTALERKQLIGKGLMGGLINDAKNFNKRAQIWFTNGFSADSDYINDLLPDNLKLTDGKEYKVLIIKDADRGRTDLDPAHWFMEATDGAIITHDMLMDVEAREAGMPMPEKQGQSKSFIVSPHAEHGALLGKYMKHAAGESLSKAMEEYVDPNTGEQGVHMIMYESAIKQQGSRKSGTARMENGKLISDSEIFRFKPEEQHTVLSELQNEHYIDPQGMPTQALSNLANSTLHKRVNQGTIDDMMSTLMNESYYTQPKAKPMRNALRESPKDITAIHNFFKNFDRMGVNDVVEMLADPKFNHIHDRIYQEITQVAKRAAQEESAEGELGFSEMDGLNEYIKDFSSVTDRMMKLGAEIGGEHNVPVLSTFLSKWSNPYVQAVMNKWMVHKATRPKIGNSATARMRPYDFRLRELIPDLKENEFYLDDYFREMSIHSTLKEKTLGEIWDKVESGGYSDKQMHYVNQVLRAMTLRVPMDSMSGSRVMQFKGFTRRKGHGILLHPRAMKAEGGADLDGDKAFIFFGGRNKVGHGEGMKQEWLDMYKANEKEFTRYKKGTKTIGENEYQLLTDKKGWIPYTTDNKMEPLYHGPDADGVTTARDLFTERTTKNVDDVLFNRKSDDNGMFYYSPIGRQRMSEAASMGRFLLGDVVIMKKNMAGTHSAISSMAGNRWTGVADVKDNLVEYEVIAKQGEKDMELFRQLARTGVALGSDPMNEIGLKKYNFFFNKLWNSLFEVKVLNISKRNEDTGVHERVGENELSDYEMGLFPSKLDMTGWFAERGVDSYQKLKRANIYQDFAEANNAYFGKNWAEGRHHTFQERKDKARNLAELDGQHRNTVLPKVAELLNQLDYSDGVLQRLNPEKLQDLYYWFNRTVKSGKFNEMREMLEREGFSVTPSDITELVMTQELWKPEKQAQFLEHPDLFMRLFGLAEAKQKPLSHTKLLFLHPISKRKLTFVETVTGVRTVQRDVDKVPTVAMHFYDKMSKEYVMRPEFAGKSTLDLIISGDRTATSRNEQYKKGQVLKFYDKNSKRTVWVEVVKDSYKISSITPEQWSKLEGWAPNGYTRNKNKWHTVFKPIPAPSAAGKMPKLERINTGRTPEAWMKYHLNELVKKADDFVQNDLADMISIKRMYELIKGQGLSKEEVMEVTKEASRIRRLDRHLARKRKQTTYENEGEEVVNDLLRKEIEKDLKINPQEGASISQAEIELKTAEAKELLTTDAQRRLFDEMMLSSLHRGDKALAEQKIEKMREDGTLTDRVEKILRERAKRTYKTSMNMFGIKNSRISDNMVKEWIQDYNDVFNQAIDLPTVSEQVKVEKEATELAKEPQLIKNEKQEVVEVDVFEDPFDGLRGLREGKLDKEGEKILSEAEDHLQYYHNSVGKYLPDIVRAVIKKDMDAMTYEDWRNVNNFFKHLRTQSMWDKLFNTITLGKPEIMKRYWWLFPETIDKRMMLHDFQLMKKKEIVMDKDGLFKTRIVRQPIHQMGKEQHIIGHTQQSLQVAVEDEIDKFHSVLDPLIDSTPEGRVIYELAVTEMEHGAGKYLSELGGKFPEQAKKLNSHAQEYYKRYNELRAKHDEIDLMTRQFKVTIVNAKGESEVVTMSGEAYKNSVKNLLTSMAKKMHGYINGNDKYREMFLSRDAKGNPRSFNSKDKNPEDFQMYDVEKFMEFIEDHIARGKDIPRDMGMDVINGIVRQYQYNAATTTEHRESISKWRLARTNPIPFENYFPHIILDKQASTKAMLSSIKTVLNDAKKDKIQKAKEVQKILWHHHQVTGEWMNPEIKQWELFDDVKHHLTEISEKMTDEQMRSHNLMSKPGMTHSRSIHIPGWTVEPRAYDKYIRSLFGSYFRSIGQIAGRHSLDQFVNKYRKIWGEELTNAWEKFITIYINNASGFPATLPESYLNDPYLNVKGTPYAWWADNNVKNKINKALERFNLTDKDIPKEMRGAGLEDIRNWSNLEAKYQMAALLSHPKTAIGNIYGGSALTIANTGFKNFKRARSIDYLRTHLNPGKDEFGNEWHHLADITKYITNLGVMPEMLTYEANIHPEVRKANMGKFVDQAIKKIQKDPSVKDSTLRGMLQEYGIADSFWNTAAYFMKTSERALRRDSFMAHLLQAYEAYGGSLPHNHPVLIEHAKRGVKATQFLYNAPHRPMFAQTQLGKVLTRFQLWSWNSVRFRNDVIRGAAIHGWREGSPEFERFRRTAQIDMLMLGLSSIFMYSLFEAALPAPWNWFQDTADWLFGDEKERDRAFFGAYPTSVAPLQMITPPVARMLPATFKGIVEQDWSKMSDYVLWTMFPFGRAARDIAGPNSIIENPARSVEKITGLPYVQFGRMMKEEKEKKKLYPSGLVTW